MQLASVSAPRPGLTRYEGLELSDPETRQLLARLPMVEVEDRADSVSIRLPAAAIVNGLRLDAAWKVARDQTRRSAARRQLRLEVPSLAVHLDDADYNFTDVAGEIESTDERSQLHVRFRHATAHQARAESADVQAEATEITFVEDRDANPPSATFRFRSGTTPLPCGLAVSLWPGAEHLGNASRFAGRILAAEQAGAWQAELAGRMTGVDLNVALGRHFPHRLSGLAAIDIRRMTIENGRVETAAGRLTAGPGAISRSLLQSAQANLHLPASNEVTAGRGNVLAYQRLGVDFEINAHGLTLAGAIEQAPGAILIDGRSVLAREPEVNVQPVLNLVRALVPRSDVQVPATRETDFLTRALPIPSIAPPAESQPQAKPAGLHSSSPKKR